MSDQQARSALASGYSGAGFPVDEDTDGNLIVEYQGKHFLITTDDIAEYAGCFDQRADLQITPVECSICSTTYREQVVQSLEPLPGRFSQLYKQDILFGTPTAENIYVEIGPASPLFVNHFRFDDKYLALCRAQMARAAGDSARLSDYLYRPPTIRVFNTRRSSIESAVERSNEIIESCLFSLSYLKHISVGLADGWEESELPFIFKRPVTGSQLPFPMVTFDPNLVGYYQMGVSSALPILQFLSFYQVLEHFFITISDEELHGQLTGQLNDPGFKPTPSQLDRIIQNVLDHRERIDRVAMIERVLAKYVDESELIDFIQAYEKYLDRPLYTRKRSILGTEVEVRLTPGTVHANLARTIDALRNGLLYSPDRYSRTARRVSFEKLTDLIRDEVPLIKYLAERVIIGSAA